MHYKTTLRLVQAYTYDFKRFALNSGLTGRNTAREIESRILKEFHRIEKGLTLKNPRPWFGRETVEVIIRLCEQYKQRPDHDPRLVDASYTALRQYGRSFEQSAPDWWNSQSLVVETWLEQREVGVENVGGCRSSQVEVDAKGDVSTLSRLMRSRSSTRNFKTDVVPSDVLRCAVEDANRSPSVCNRQGTRVRIYSRGPDAESILKLQNGNSGFGADASHIALITTDLTSFLTVGERNQGFIDGGMFAMTFQYSLHAQNVGTCSLNWSVVPKRDQLLRSKLSLPDEESVIMMVAIGYPEHDSLTTNSPSRSLTQIALRGIDARDERVLN